MISSVISKLKLTQLTEAGAQGILASTSNATALRGPRSQQSLLGQAGHEDVQLLPTVRSGGGHAATAQRRRARLLRQRRGGGSTVQAGRGQLTRHSPRGAGTAAQSAEIDVAGWPVESHRHALLVEDDGDGLGIRGGRGGGCPLLGGSLLLLLRRHRLGTGLPGQRSLVIRRRRGHALEAHGTVVTPLHPLGGSGQLGTAGRRRRGHRCLDYVCASRQVQPVEDSFGQPLLGIVSGWGEGASCILQGTAPRLMLAQVLVQVVGAPAA